MASLTTAQLQALKADVAADPALGPLPHTEDNALAVAAAYNAAASPDYWVWRTAVSRDEYVGSTSTDGTTFSWVGAGYITRAQGERDAWRDLFNAAGYANPSLANVRQAVGDIFSGSTAPAPANRAHLLAVSRRKARRAEKLFAAGAGSTASPALLGWEGALTGADVLNAWNS